MTPLEQAAKKVGSNAELARRLKISRASITDLGKYVPRGKALEVEEITGIPRWVLCPKIFRKLFR